MTEAILVEIAPGELIDKITILEIKAERIGDPAKRANVAVELATLNETRDSAIAFMRQATRWCLQGHP